mmetsp:Transcript_111359/g.265671  ORF Transcript_111359/g.265671 Transcript_111359/m.265671 type:complete len:363 (+) Transcript_111359:166-1254(+)
MMPLLQGALHQQLSSARARDGACSKCSGDLGHLEELLLGIDSDSLRCSRFPNVGTGHLAISQEAFAEVLLGEGNHLVHGGRWHFQKLRESSGKAQACRNILGEVSVLQVRHEATIHFLHGMRKAGVGTVRVHGQLERGVIRHLSFVRVQVPLMQCARILQVETRNQRLYLTADCLHFVRKPEEDTLCEVINALIEQRLFGQLLTIPLLRTPAAIHDSWMNDLSRVAQADAQVVGALQDFRKDAQEPLESCDGVGGLTLRRDSSQNLPFGAEDRGPFAPLGETTCPWQCLEPNERQTVSLLLHLGSKKDVATRARRHASDDGARLDVGVEGLKVLAVGKGRHRQDDHIRLAGEAGVVGDVGGC